MVTQQNVERRRKLRALEAKRDSLLTQIASGKAKLVEVRAALKNMRKNR